MTPFPAAWAFGANKCLTTLLVQALWGPLQSRACKGGERVKTDLPSYYFTFKGAEYCHFISSSMESVLTLSPSQEGANWIPMSHLCWFAKVATETRGTDFGGRGCSTAGRESLCKYCSSTFIYGSCWSPCLQDDCNHSNGSGGGFSVVHTPDSGSWWYQQRGVSTVDDEWIMGEHTHSPGRQQSLALGVSQVDSSAQTPWGWAWERNGKGTEDKWGWMFSWLKRKYTQVSLCTISKRAIYPQFNFCLVHPGFPLLGVAWRKAGMGPQMLKHFGSTLRRTQSIAFVSVVARLEMVPLCEHLRTNQTPKHADFVIGISGCNLTSLLTSGY